MMAAILRAKEVSFIQTSPKLVSVTKQATVTGYSHCSDVMMSAIASQITLFTILYLTVYSGTDQRKYQSSASLALVTGIHRWPVNSPHTGSVTRTMFPLMMASWGEIISSISPMKIFLNQIFQLKSLLGVKQTWFEHMPFVINLNLIYHITNAVFACFDGNIGYWCRPVVFLINRNSHGTELNNAKLVALHILRMLSLDMCPSIHD